MDTELEFDRGKIDVAYCARQTYKENLISPGQRYSTPIVNDSILGLWHLRFHPHYLSYPNAKKLKLADLINFDERLAEIDKSLMCELSFLKYKRDHYRKLTGQSLIIPDIGDGCTSGILTDVVTKTKEKIRNESDLMIDFDGIHDTEGWKRIADRVGTTPEKLLEANLDKHAYALFIIGYTFPRIDQGTQIEEFMEGNWLKNLSRLENPIEYTEQLIGRKLRE